MQVDPLLSYVGSVIANSILRNMPNGRSIPDAYLLDFTRRVLNRLIEEAKSAGVKLDSLAAVSVMMDRIGPWSFVAELEAAGICSACSAVGPCAHKVAQAARLN